MSRFYPTGGGGSGTGSSDCSATAGDVLSGKAYIGADTNDDVGTGTLALTGNAAQSNVLSGKTFYSNNAKAKLTGTMANIGAIDPAKSISLSSGSLYVRMSNGAHVTNSSSGYPEVSIPQATLASGIALTAAKLAKGQTVCGVAGTYTADANATAAYIYKGKTAYVNGSKITGSMTVSSVVSFSVAATSYNSVTATWKWPSKGPYSGVIIRYKTGSYPTSVTDGTQGYKGTGTASGLNASSSATISGLSQNTKYYFRIWVYCTCSAGDMYSGTRDATATTKPRGQQTFTSSGTFTVPSGVTSIDVFCVGGGGAGGRAYNNGDEPARGAGGGAGGYTKTVSKISVSSGQQLVITVGAGGAGGVYGESPTDGNMSSVVRSGTTLCSANGGEKGTSYRFSQNGGSGGSGGGSGGEATSQGYESDRCGNGGSDGSNGYVWSVSSESFVFASAAEGQGTTTRAFGSSSGTLYSGGGAGSNYYGGYPASGGAGGGGNTAAAGSANTGGGGGGATVGGYGTKGGSGIVLIRWGY